MKAWRNLAWTGKSYAVISRPLPVDGDGFLPDLLEADEVRKLSKLPGWELCDRNGAEVIGLRMDELLRRRATYQSQLDQSQLVVHDLQRRISDIDEQCAKLRGDSQAAVERAQAEATTPIDIDALNWHELRSLAAQHNIVLSPNEKSREKLADALRVVLNKPAQSASAAPTEAAPAAPAPKPATAAKPGAKSKE